MIKTLFPRVVLLAALLGVRVLYAQSTEITGQILDASQSVVAGATAELFEQAQASGLRIVSGLVLASVLLRFAAAAPENASMPCWSCVFSASRTSGVTCWQIRHSVESEHTSPNSVG